MKIAKGIHVGTSGWNYDAWKVNLMLSPMIAAAAISMRPVFVISNAMRLRKQKI